MRVYVILLLWPCVFSSLAQAAKVKEIRVSYTADYTRVVLDVDAPIKHNLILADNPKRLIVELYGSSLNVTFKNSLKNIVLTNTPIDFIHSSTASKKELRITFDLNKAITPRSFSIKKRAGSNDRLVIDLYDPFEFAVADKNKLPAKSSASAITAAKNASSATKKGSESRSVITSVISSVKSSEGGLLGEKPVENKAPVDEFAEIQTSDFSVTHTQFVSARADMNETKKNTSTKSFAEVVRKRTILIAIDPGHGGEDSGALGPNNMREKDVTLAISKELVEEINAQPGFNARLLRTGDYYLGLKKRRDLARDMKADLMISVHADSFTDSNAFGASVFALSRKGATSEMARFLAQRENESDLIGRVAGVNLEDKDAMLVGVLVDLSMTATVNSSLEVGSKVLSAISGIAPLHANHVEQAGFLVLKSPDVPSILVETGFISNKKESAKLDSSTYREQMAQAIFKGVRQYFELHPPATSEKEANTQSKK